MINIFTSNKNKRELSEERDRQTKDRANTATIQRMVEKSNRILVSIRTHRFPIDPFPNTINVEETRITLITRTFFFTSEVRSVDIKDISNVFINFSPLYAQIVIISKTFSQNNMRIDNLYKKEAIYLRRIVEGLRMFEAKDINTTSYSNEELIRKLEQLSTVGIVK